VTYTVVAADVVAGDGAATAANIANKFAAAVAAAAGTPGTSAADLVTVSRIGNVLTLTSTVAGQTVADSSVTVTADATNTATGVTVNQVSEGTDATVDIDTIDFTGLTFAAGDVVTVSFNDGGVHTASYTVGASDTLGDVLTGLEALIESASTASSSDVAGNTIVLTHGTAGAGSTITDIATTVDRAPITTMTNVAVERTEGADATVGPNVVTAAADHLTGGDGHDVFVINYSNIDPAGTDLVNRVTFSAMDTIEDLNLGGNVAGTNVDTIDLPFTVSTLVNAGAPVAMASTAADLFDAVQALYAPGGTMANAAAGTAGLFTYGGDTYLIADRNGSVDGFATTDIIIKVTGVTGTLDLTDLV
jgi:hypothetical protein